MSSAQEGVGRMPDFFIVGHEKCGTTALYKMLRAHPQVFMPDYKEPRFFSWDLRAAPPPPGAEVPATLERYLELFAPAEPAQLVGEASPQYIRSPGAAAQIAAAQPHARIIAIFREPVAFLRSFHIQAVRSRLETERDLRRALALEPSRRAGREMPANTHVSWLLYSEHVDYVEQLRRFHSVFPPEQVLPLIYEDYRRENRATLRAVMRFLEIDETIPVEPVETRRETHQAVRFMPLHGVTRRLRMARNRPERADPITRAVAALAPRPAREAWRRLVYKVPEPLERETELELRRRFKPNVEAFGEYLGRDLVTLWGYEQV
ncbi:MAG TPA: sulfotransferase [Solirubrobacteraceae bacterium]